MIFHPIKKEIRFKNHENHIILYFLNKAIDIINKYKNQVNNLNEIEWIFFMLPLRHTNIKENIFYVLNEAWNNKFLCNNKSLYNNKSSCNNQSLLKEFIVATYKKANFGEDFNSNSYELELNQNEFINYLRKLIWKENIYKLLTLQKTALIPSSPKRLLQPTCTLEVVLQQDVPVGDL